MASSDNVLRCGLTPKHVDVDEVLSVADFAPLARPVLTPVREADSVWRYDVPVPDFVLRRVELTGVVTLPGGVPRLALCTAGEMAIGPLRLSPGRAAFIGAQHGSAELQGTGQVFVASA
jgi:mannose-6-phosphate isomerase